MPGVSGRFRQPLDSKCPQWMLRKGQQAGGREGVGGNVLFPLSRWTWEMQRTKGCPLPVPARVPGKRQRETPHGGSPWWGGLLTHQVRPASQGMWCQEQGSRDGQEGGRSGMARPFCSSHARWWSWHFLLGNPVPVPAWVASGWALRHLGLLPAGSELGKASRGPLASPRVGCCGQPCLASQVAIAHHCCPLLTRLVWGGVSSTGLSQSGQGPRGLGAPTQRPSLARPSEG